ncbi:MAG: CpaF family protein [Candidatus Omnitrophica bacterium]|nr:CpaF family protein [Candidatus Omnitrophota bacterium]MCB9746882.1 CpaF family protein [Candidatus Omnitrophota bacterium]
MAAGDIIDRVNRYLINHTDFFKVKDELSDSQLKEFVLKAIQDLCKIENLSLSADQREILAGNLVSAVVSLGPIRPLMEDQTITEIMINGFDQIYIQRDGRIVKTDVKFQDNRHLLHTIHKILEGSGSNKRVDESSPYVDFSLADGSRVNVILPPCSMVGPCMTIRKFRNDIGSVDDLIELKMFDKKIATLMIAAMKAKLNVVYCGSTGAGKTTMMNVFSQHIPSHERIITIEDTPELILKQEHVVTLATKPANIEGRGQIEMDELFRNCLRMRPDRIIIGEVRGGEMLDMIQSITSGHSGSLAIVHAETPEDCFSRMITMVLMTGIRLSTSEIQKQVANAIDLIVHIELFMDGLRRVTHISDLTHDKATGKNVMHHVFQFIEEGLDEKGEIVGQWKMDKRTPSFYQKFKKRRVTLPEGFFES